MSALPSALVRTSTGNVATGSVAGNPVGLPVRRSKREPCSQHSSVQLPHFWSNLALGERDGGVRADVLDREHLVAVAGDGDVLGSEGHRKSLVLEDVGQGAGSLERHETSLSTFFSSSASTVAVRDASIAGTAILRIRSLKKPCTTRRRASASETPRERR